jgi:hypothetical protein
VDVPEYGVGGRRGDFDPLIRRAVLRRPSGSVGTDTKHRATTASASRLSVARLRPLRDVRPWIDRELVEGAQRVLRLLPLPPWLPCRERHEGGTRRPVCRRTRTAPGWSSGLCPNRCLPSTNTVTYGEIIERHPCGANLLEWLRNRCFGRSRLGSAHRFPSGPDRPLQHCCVIAFRSPEQSLCLIKARVEATAPSPYRAW